jgi:DNA-binding response OmpR family regulator
LKAVRGSLSEALHLEIGPLICDKARHELRYRSRTVSLTTIELAILSALASQPERLMSRQELRDKVWHSSEKVDLRTIDVHIGHLRKKLRRFKLPPDSMPVIQTVWGLGYRLRRHRPG